MRGGGRNNRRQMRRHFFRRRPLIESGIGTAPHRDFPIAKWLWSEPFDHIVSIVRFLRERFEIAARISTPANVNQREYVTMGGKIRGARMITVRDVRSQGENHR